MTRRQTRTSLTIVGMAVLTTMVATTISHVHPESALGLPNKPGGLSDLLGLSLSDIESGLSQPPSDPRVDNTAGGAGPTPNLIPGNEMGLANTLGQDGAKGGEVVPTDDESVAEDNDNSNGNVGDSNYEKFQGCLADAVGEGSPTEQQVRDCAESSYQNDSETTPSDGPDASEKEEGENGETGHLSTVDAEDEEDEDEDLEE
jgi:hypothetical protein